MRIEEGAGTSSRARGVSTSAAIDSHPLRRGGTNPGRVVIRGQALQSRVALHRERHAFSWSASRSASAAVKAVAHPRAFVAGPVARAQPRCEHARARTVGAEAPRGTPCTGRSLRVTDALRR